MIFFSWAMAQSQRLTQWATPVNQAAVKNLFKVDDRIYRSAQPDSSGMKVLQQLNVQSVLNLREFHSDEKEASGTGLKLYRVPMNAARINDDELVAALKIIQEASSPILVHCWHGADRTGTVVAMYRILIQGWSKEAAIDELVNGGYGYHTIYGNIVRYIESADLDSLKHKLSAAVEGKQGRAR